MKRILAFHGSPRTQGNSSIMLQHFLEGAGRNQSIITEIRPRNLNLKDCQGCLRCNVLQRCSISDDDWTDLSAEILASDILVFASPVYFHHLPAPLKRIIDRFRSFVHVQITSDGLVHTPWVTWNKDFVLLLSMGSHDPVEAGPIVELFEFMTSILGSGNRLHVISATRLAVTGQIERSRDHLENLYTKLKLPAGLAERDYRQNTTILRQCRDLGAEISRKTSD
jgi:hypothetical protein